MLSKEKIIEFYIAQYEKSSKKKPKNISRSQGFERRIDNLGRNLHRAKPYQMSSKVLEDYHRQIKNLAYFAYHYHNQRSINQLRERVLPELVRLDLGMILNEEREELSEDFLDYLEQELPGALCTKSLFEVHRSYKEYVIKNKILELVPSRPELEFPEVLEMERHFILHIGPTNSGKTFHALEQLRMAQNGIYLGPLRLLALEVYEKMQDYGTPCTMLTGQECIQDQGSRVIAATVEMLDIQEEFDIAVIDEAQMVQDDLRGHSWTRAILGIHAKEIHICMSPAAESVITHLIGLTGDRYEVCRYERKTELCCENEPFLFPEDVQEGDALIVFSKRSVLDIAGRLEKEGIAASVIYGSLPPEIRRRQMHLFTGGKTKVVVSTDAIGMGLNLPVRRIVFIQMDKYDGNGRRPLQVPEIKQIAGRAGRYGIYDVGYVTAMGQPGLEYLSEQLPKNEEPVKTVSLGFPQVLLNLDGKLDEILKIWHQGETAVPFEKVSIEDMLFLYEKAWNQREHIVGFSDKHSLYQMISCPIDVQDRKVVSLWLDYCKTYTADVSLRYPELESCGKEGLPKYETYYKELDLYYQFSYRMGKTIDTEWLEQEREDTENSIMKYLMRGKKDYIATCKYCGRILPIAYGRRVCTRCGREEFRSGRQKERTKRWNK